MDRKEHHARTGGSQKSLAAIRICQMVCAGLALAIFRQAERNGNFFPGNSTSLDVSSVGRCRGFQGRLMVRRCFGHDLHF